MFQTLLLGVLALLPLRLATEPQASPSPSAASSATPLPDTAALVTEADARFALRSEGAMGDVADPREVDLAIDLYRKALAPSFTDIPTLAKLMRALHFRGAYTGADVNAKKALFEEGRKLGQDAVDRLERDARAVRGVSRVEALRKVKGAPALYLWTAGHWGEWALVRGKFAAARSGIAGRLRDLAQTVIDIDPGFDDAAGYRILGRLHSEAPKIPFITGWVSHNRGVEYLRRALAISPRHPVTCYFLGEAILDHDASRRDEALLLLDQCVNLAPRPDTRLEDRHYTRLARKRLDEMRGGSGQ